MASKLLTDEEKEEIEEIFNLFDKDGDGTVTGKELADVMRTLGLTPTRDEIQSMITDADEDGNGKISFEEFYGMISRKMTVKDPEAEIRDAFKVFDFKKTGYIDASKLREVMLTLGEKLTEEEVEEMIREADTDHDGQIDIDEFSQLLLSDK